MRKSDIVIFGFKNFIRNKGNFLIILLLTISSTLLLFGFSYFNSLLTLWNEMVEKDSTFKYYTISYDIKYKKENIVKELESLDFIQYVHTNTYEVYTIGYAENFQDDFYTGQIKLLPIQNHTIIEGKKAEKDFELVCPNLFFPAMDKTFLSNKLIDLSSKIGNQMSIRMISSNNKYEFSLVGLIDYGETYGDFSTCYTTLNTIKKLNNNMTYHEDSEIINTTLFILVNDKSRIDEVLHIEGINNYSYRSVIDTSIGEETLQLFFNFSIILFILSSIIVYFIFKKRNLQNNSFNGLMYSLGYSKKEINAINLVEISSISLISIIMTMTITYFFNYIYVKLFLNSYTLYFDLHISISWLGFLFIIILNIIIPFLASILIIKKINKIETRQLLGDVDV